MHNTTTDSMPQPSGIARCRRVHRSRIAEQAVSGARKSEDAAQAWNGTVLGARGFGTLVSCDTQTWDGNAAAADKGTLLLESASAGDYFGTILVCYHTCQPYLQTRVGRNLRRDVGPPPHDESDDRCFSDS